MSITQLLLIALVFSALYWLGLKMNPPADFHRGIVPEPNNMLTPYSRGYVPTRREEE